MGADMYTGWATGYQVSSEERPPFIVESSFNFRQRGPEEAQCHTDSSRHNDLLDSMKHVE